MSNYLITTESGSTYHVDTEDGFWTKYSKTGMSYGRERIWSMQHSPNPKGYPAMNDEVCSWKHGIPEVGEHMFISSRDVWWISTRVVSVEEK